jgi:D-psicose/D-tagatose/L-ribulose 3-epimerase
LCSQIFSDRFYLTNEIAPEEKAMRFGICIDLLNAPAAAAAGFDYIEGALTQIVPATDEEFKRIAEAVERSGIRMEAMNLILPNSFRLTGPDADFNQALEYLEKGFARAQLLGAAQQGFGAPGARNCPAGWPMEKALAQLADFLNKAAALAARHGIRIAVEPMNAGDCNIVNTMPEALALAKAAGVKEQGVLADWYHMARQGEGAQAMAEAGASLLHCHIANPAGRRFPLPGDGADYSAFFGVLKGTGYRGRVSIEGAGGPGEYAAALVRLREYP